MAANKIKQYKVLRQISVNQLTELLEFAEKASENNISRMQFKIMYNEYGTIVSEFKKHHQSLLSLLATQESEDVNAEESIRKDFEFNCSYVSVLYTNMFSNEDFAKNTKNESISINSKPNVKLPKIEIPKFAGDIKQFKTFNDMFTSLIHENDCLCDIEKFNYLLSFLQGEALNLVQRINLSSENYKTAYDLLTKKYDNPRVIAFAHLQAMDNAPYITNSKSLKSLQNLLNIFTENLAALKNLGFNVEDWDFLLYYLLTKHLDEDLITKFELEKIDGSNLPSYESLKEFILKQCNALETVKYSIKPQCNFKPESKKSNSPVSFNKKSVSTFFSNTNKPICIFCKAAHSIYKCDQFSRKTPVERLQIAQNYNWCTNCLSKQHNVKTCNSLNTCRSCNKRHHSLLHISKFEYDSNAPSTSYPTRSTLPLNSQIQTDSIVNSATDPRSTAHLNRDETYDGDRVNMTNAQNNFCGLGSCTAKILLSTAFVNILDHSGNYQKVRVLLDCGSQTSYISEKCMKDLGLTQYKSSLSIQGLGSMQEVASLGGVSCTIKPINKNAPLIKFEAFILKKLCSNLPNHNVNISNCSYLRDLELADPNFFSPGPIDLLLGADVFPYILENERITGGPDEPVAINTKFGWVVMGKCLSQKSIIKNTTSLFSSVHDEDMFRLDSVIKRFWEIEEIPKTKIFSADDMKCELIYSTTHARNTDGRYIVDLPFKNSLPYFDVEDSYLIALRRLLSLEKRLQSTAKMYLLYSNQIKEYIDNDYLELVQENSKPKLCYYIPHHCVNKSEKFRIVFDASAKTAQGLSLNDTLLTGPKLQNDIVSILLNFRIHKVVFTCDIKSMFTQIFVNRNHQDFQRILWRFSPNSPIKEYRLKRVTFGLSCSPYLANRTILQLADDEHLKYPLASNVLKNDIYVDDILTGASSFSDAKHLRNELMNILKSARFELRKWASNCPELLRDLPESHIQMQALSFDSKEEYLKILGLNWQPRCDSFSYSVEPLNRQCTKRTILSDIARIFDPLGFISPVTIFTKCFLQMLWTLGLDWDDIPAPDISEKWLNFKSELLHLSEFKIPRLILPDSYSFNCQLHGFCDASQKAYACVVYLRTTNICGDIKTCLLMAKSKVAPLKQISVPRLELSAAVLLADLISYIIHNFKNSIKFSSIFAWSDSTIVLSWIKSSPHRWKTFVSNRVARIQDKVASHLWRHVNSQDNPADCASRGLLPSQLLNTSLWWAGPSWLSQNEDCWPNKNFENAEFSEICSQEKTITLSAIDNENFLEQLINNSSNLSKVLNIVTYINRFIFNLKNINKPKTGCISLTEINQSLEHCVKYVQSISFFHIISLLQNKKLLPKQFRKLNCFLDASHILRVGGRISRAQITFEQKHPAILPSNHHFTKILIEYFHKMYLHPGNQTLNFLIMQRFWILSAKRVIRKVLSTCQKCWRTNPKPYQPTMADLPTLRVSQVKPFSSVAVDYAGPFLTRLGKIRGSKTFKSYICVFICFATRAVHLELASDLSTEAFLAALRRFISRRGRCSKIFSDCGTNFIGAHKEILNLYKFAADKEAIEWHFNPPSAPHFTGLAEAGVKSVKTHLKRVIGEQILTYEEFYTILVQIEALLNSRPLCPLSTDPNDLNAITPGHFLTLEPLSAIPDPDLLGSKLNHLNRWQLLQRMQQAFWKRWQNEYLHTLQQRGKWLEPTFPIKMGSMVVIKNDLCPPLKWLLGRVLDVHPGRDGVIRVATVLTKNGMVCRPLVKLCPLPCSQDQ